MVEIAPMKEVSHPFVPSIVADASKPDELWRLLEIAKEQKQMLSHVEQVCRELLGQMAAGDKKTRRIALEDGRKLKLVFPNSYWSQPVLKELAKEDAEMSKVYLRVSKYDPVLREVGKLRETTGNERFERYKMKLLRAESPSTSPPTVTLEE